MPMHFKQWSKTTLHLASGKVNELILGKRQLQKQTSFTNVMPYHNYHDNHFIQLILYPSCPNLMIFWYILWYFWYIWWYFDIFDNIFDIFDDIFDIYFDDIFYIIIFDDIFNIFDDISDIFDDIFSCNKQACTVPLQSAQYDRRFQPGAVPRSIPRHS